jgi:hypothetical protein
MIALAHAVIKHALLDLRQGRTPAHKPYKYKYHRDMGLGELDAFDSAKRFLLDTTGSWSRSREAWCDIAGLSSEAVRDEAVGVMKLWGERMA